MLLLYLHNIFILCSANVATIWDEHLRLAGSRHPLRALLSFLRQLGQDGRLLCRRVCCLQE